MVVNTEPRTETQETQETNGREPPHDGSRPTETKAVRDATATYRSESDLVGQFLDECCDLGNPDKWTASQRLRHEYEKWSAERGVRAVAGKAFAEKLREHGLEPRKTQEGRGWDGVEMRQ